MAYCKKCGTFIENDVRFCPKCGEQIETINDNTIVAERENPYAYKQPPSQKPPMPNTYLWQAIVVTIICCWPLGIPAIVYATQVSSKYNAGDYEGSLRASKNAKNFALWSLITAIICIVIYCILVFCLGIGTALLGNYF